ncbi:hypothetical protein [Microbacterium shaanxiense]
MIDALVGQDERMSNLTLSIIVLVLVPAAALLVLAGMARVRSRRLPRSPGPRFAPTADGAVLRDALPAAPPRRSSERSSTRCREPGRHRWVVASALSAARRRLDR